MDGKTSTGHNVLANMLLDVRAKPTKLPLSLLEAITSNFSDEQEIGRGGFAIVYKGMLGNGMVAVKKLSKTFDIHEKKFSQEVQCLLKAQHKNIVRFLGYCADTQGEMADHEGKFVMADRRNRLLCFEFVPNGTLYDYITDASSGLEWRVRFQIIMGICEGLLYLHENHIAHLDLKPSNILLDDYMVPKIADFGLSRCFDESQSKVVTSKLIGTLGYLAPEFYSGQITSKLDIYSLGVIILEMLTGQKGYSTVEKILESWRNRLEISCNDTPLRQVRACAEIGIMCMDPNPENRPIAQHIIKIFKEQGNTNEFIEAGTNSSLAETEKVDLENTLVDESQTQLKEYGSVSKSRNEKHSEGSASEHGDFNEPQYPAEETDNIYDVAWRTTRQRLLQEGVSEATVVDISKIVRNEFLSLSKQLVLSRQKHALLIETLRQLETEKVDLENTSTLVDESMELHSIEE